MVFHPRGRNGGATLQVLRPGAGQIASIWIYPEEHDEPKGFAAGMTLRPYQRQSLAFMINVERSQDAALKGRQTHFGKHPLMHRSGDVDGTSVRGGWLVDEARAAAPLATPCSPSHTCAAREAPSPPLKPIPSSYMHALATLYSAGVRIRVRQSV